MEDQACQGKIHNDMSDEEITGRVLEPGEYEGIQLAEEMGLRGKTMRIRLRTRPVDEYTIKEPDHGGPYNTTT